MQKLMQKMIEKMMQKMMKKKLQKKLRRCVEEVRTNLVTRYQSRIVLSCTPCQSNQFQTREPNSQSNARPQAESQAPGKKSRDQYQAQALLTAEWRREPEHATQRQRQPRSGTHTVVVGRRRWARVVGRLVGLGVVLVSVRSSVVRSSGRRSSASSSRSPV